MKLYFFVLYCTYFVYASPAVDVSNDIEPSPNNNDTNLDNPGTVTVSQLTNMTFGLLRNMLEKYNPNYGDCFEYLIINDDLMELVKCSDAMNEPLNIIFELAARTNSAVNVTSDLVAQVTDCGYDMNCYTTLALLNAKLLSYKFIPIISQIMLDVGKVIAMPAVLSECLTENVSYESYNTVKNFGRCLMDTSIDFWNE